MPLNAGRAGFRTRTRSFDPADILEDNNLPVVGDILPQFGPTVGAKIAIDGVLFRPQEIRYEPPPTIGTATGGGEFLQGKPKLFLVWDASNINTFQALSVIYHSKVNIPPGALVEVIWPNPYTAGRYEATLGMMRMPRFVWRELWLRSVEVEIARFGVRLEELAGYY